MDDYVDTAVLGTEDRFAIGQPVPRSEDPVLLRGEGHYSDDFNLPGQAYAVIVRSPVAHGAIRRIGASRWPANSWMRATAWSCSTSAKQQWNRCCCVRRAGPYRRGILGISAKSSRSRCRRSPPFERRYWGRKVLRPGALSRCC